MYTLFVGNKKLTYKTWWGLRRRLDKEAEAMPNGGKDFASLRLAFKYGKWISLCFWKRIDGKEWGWRADEGIPKPEDTRFACGQRSMLRTAMQQTIEVTV